MSNYAVLTGDLVNSRRNKSDHFQQMIGGLSEALQYCAANYPCRFELYRGDSFQILLQEPKDSIIIAILVRIKLKLMSANGIWDARIGVGIGRVEHPTTSLSSSLGEAYVLSGSALDAIGSNRLVIKTSNEDANTRLVLLTRFCDNLISKLSQKQALALWHYLTLDNAIHQQVAEAMGTSRVNVTQLLNNAGYDLIRDYIATAQGIIDSIGV